MVIKLRKQKEQFAIVFMIFCFIGILITSYLILNTKKDINSNLNTRQSLDKYITKEDDEHLNIDFSELKKINQDTVGYLKVPNTNVEYIVVKGNDNDYYLNHDFNKKRNTAGWIFQDYRNKVNGEDKNLIIYGHETHDGSMFGSLSNLLKEENLNDQMIITFTTEESEKQYQIFSIYKVEPENYYIETEFTEEEFERFKVEMQKRSIHKFDVDLKNKNIITLSTCQNHGAKRLAVHAVEI